MEGEGEKTIIEALPDTDGVYLVGMWATIKVRVTDGQPVIEGVTRVIPSKEVTTAYTHLHHLLRRPLVGPGLPG